MNILKDTNNNLPVSFLKNFVTKSWDSVEELKAELNAIKDDFGNNEQISKILNDLIDSYLICIGQVEFLLNHNDYLKVGDKKEIVPEAENKPIEVEPQQAIEIENQEQKAVDPFDCTFDAPKGEKLTDFDLYGIQPEIKSEPEIPVTIKPQAIVSEDDMWNCDFDEPVGEGITDKDLYPEDK